MARRAISAALKPGEKAIKPVRANIGLRARYRRKLEYMLDQMHWDVSETILAAYAEAPPVATAMAGDRTPSERLAGIVRALSAKWIRRINEGAQQLAEWFALSVKQRSDITLKRILREAGISVRFKPTAAVVDAMTAGVIENVSLIKSIPQQYFTRIEGAVMRSAATGRDVGALTRELSSGYGITARRAKFIARDQTNKMTAVIVKTRQSEIGATHAIWRHSHGAHEPRPSHLAADGRRYEIDKGMYLEDVGGKWAWLQPGYAINCGCVSQTIIPGLEDEFDEEDAA